MRSRTITVRLPNQSFLILKQIAEREADSVSDYVRSLLDKEFIRQQETEQLVALEKRLIDRMDSNHQLVIKIAKFLRNSR